MNLGAILGVLLVLVLFGLWLWGGSRLLALVPMNETIRQVIYIVAVLLIGTFLILWVVQLLMGIGPRIVW